MHMAMAKSRPDGLRLRQSQLFLELMDCVDNIVLILDPAFKIVQANRYATSLLGYSSSQLTGKPLPLLLKPEERERIKELVRNPSVRQGGEVEFLTRSYRPITLSFSLSPLVEETRGFLLAGRVVDTQDPSRATDPSNGLAERVLKGFAGPAYVIDGTSRTVRKCNDAALSVFGFPREEIVGRRLLDHASNEEERRGNEELMARADAVYATEGIFQARVAFPRKGGVPLPCSLVGLPFFWPDGSLALTIALLFDRSFEEDSMVEIANILDRVNDLAAELSAALSGYAKRGKSSSLAELGFTRRQVEIARFISLGASSKDIGFRLGIAESTVKNHLSVMYRKLGAASRIDFMRLLSENCIKIE
jgi:PAS domain S-box-containing protein